MTDSFKRDKQICEAATEGPWIPLLNLADDWVESEVGVLQPGEVTALIGGRVRATEKEFERIESNIKFISAARTRWPAALEEIDRLNQLATEMIKENRPMKAELMDYSEEIQQAKGRIEELTASNIRMDQRLSEAMDRMWNAEGKNRELVGALGAIYSIAADLQPNNEHLHLKDFLSDINGIYKIASDALSPKDES